MIIVYIKTDAQNRIIAINSSAFLQNIEGWIEIDRGDGDRYTHAQGRYFPLPLMTDGGARRYSYVKGKAVERPAEEIAADEAAAVVPAQPTNEERIAELEAALDMLLTGVTE